jgi:hypothetical protein
MAHVNSAHLPLDDGKDESGWVVLVVQDAVDRGLVLVGGFAGDVAVGWRRGLRHQASGADSFPPESR